MDTFNQEDTFQWRSRARIVAYVDLGLTSIGLLYVLILAIGASLFTAVAMNPATPVGDGDEQLVVEQQEVLALSAWILWVLVVILAGITLAQLYAVVKLLKGTNLGADYTEALHDVGIWRKATILYFICQILGGFILGTYKGMVFGLLLRGGFFYIVQKFVEELKTHCSTIQGPTGVTVKN